MTYREFVDRGPLATRLCHHAFVLLQHRQRNTASGHSRVQRRSFREAEHAAELSGEAGRDLFPRSLVVKECSVWTVLQAGRVGQRTEEGAGLAHVPGRQTGEGTPRVLKRTQRTFERIVRHEFLSSIELDELEPAQLELQIAATLFELLAVLPSPLDGRPEIVLVAQRIQNVVHVGKLPLHMLLRALGPLIPVHGIRVAGLAVLDHIHRLSDVQTVGILLDFLHKRRSNAEVALSEQVHRNRAIDQRRVLAHDIVAGGRQGHVFELLLQRLAVLVHGRVHLFHVVVDFVKGLLDRVLQLGQRHGSGVWVIGDGVSGVGEQVDGSLEVGNGL